MLLLVVLFLPPAFSLPLTSAFHGNALAITSPEHWNTDVANAQVFVCIGILCAYALGWPYAQGKEREMLFLGMHIEWWRIMFAAGLLPALLQAQTPPLI